MAAAGPSFEAQRAAMLSADELQQLTKELFHWSSDMKKKSGRKGLAAEPAPAATPTAAAPPVGQSSTADRAAATRHPAAHTYDHYRNKWDKFDVDAALADTEGSDSGAANGTNPRRQQPSGTASSGKSQALNIPAAKVTVPVGPSRSRSTTAAEAGAAPSTAEGWKEAGNQHFKQGRLRQAVEAYTASLAVQPSCLAYANRAMARLKLGQRAEAEADCTEAIALDPLYVKAYQRRAAARHLQANLLGAAEDWEEVLRLEPNNKQAASERAECVQQLLKDEGLPLSALSEALPVRLAAAGSGKADGEDAVAIVPAAASASQAGAPHSVHSGADSDALVELCSVYKASKQPGGRAGASLAPASPADGQQAAQTGAATLPAATPAAVVQVLGDVVADDALPDLPEAAQPPASTQSPGAATQPPAPACQSAPHAAQAQPAVQCTPQQHLTQQSSPQLPDGQLREGVGAGHGQAPAAQLAAAVQPALPSAVQGQTGKAAPLRLPRSGLEFEKAWRGLKGDTQQQAAYLLSLPAPQLPALLRQALTPGLLAAAAAALLGPGAHQQPDAAVALLEGLSRVQRFDINLLSVPASQKAELGQAWDQAQAQLAGRHAELARRMDALRQSYKL